MTKPQRGGARPGSGRKALGKVRLGIYVQKQTKHALERQARVNKTTPGGVVDEMMHERDWNRPQFTNGMSLEHSALHWLQ